MAKVNTKKVAKRLVKHFGSQAKAAKALDVSQVSVSYWINGKTGISPAVAIRAQKATEGAIKASELCQDLAGL